MNTHKQKVIYHAQPLNLQDVCFLNLLDWTGSCTLKCSSFAWSPRLTGSLSRFQGGQQGNGEEFACSPCVCIDSFQVLQLPLTVQKHAWRKIKPQWLNFYLPDPLWCIPHCGVQWVATHPIRKGCIKKKSKLYHTFPHHSREKRFLWSGGRIHTYQ